MGEGEPRGACPTSLLCDLEHAADPAGPGALLYPEDTRDHLDLALPGCWLWPSRFCDKRRGCLAPNQGKGLSSKT